MTIVQIISYLVRQMINAILTQLAFVNLELRMKRIVISVTMDVVDQDASLMLVQLEFQDVLQSNLTATWSHINVI